MVLHDFKKGEESLPCNYHHKSSELPQKRFREFSMQTTGPIFITKTILLLQCSMVSGKSLHAPMKLSKLLTSLQMELMNNQAEYLVL